MKYIYLFALDDVTSQDKAYMRKYGIEILGKNFFNGERNLAVKGELSNLKRYCKEYLGYEMHPDYLYKENEFAGDIVDSCKDSKVKDDNITLNNLPKKPNEERWFQLIKPFGEYNVIRVRCETDWRKGEGNITYGMVAFSSRTNHYGKHASSDLSSGWGLGNNFKLQDVLKFLKEHQANVSSKKALYGDSVKPKDSLQTFMFTSKDSGRRFVVKAKNTQDAITKFYNAVNDSKAEDSIKDEAKTVGEAMDEMESACSSAKNANEALNAAGKILREHKGNPIYEKAWQRLHNSGFFNDSVKK